MSAVVVQRVPPEHLEQELAKVADRYDPPSPVWAWLDGQQQRGELLGWATTLKGARGLVLTLQSVAGGSRAERLVWVPAEHIRPRRD